MSDQEKQPKPERVLDQSETWPAIRAFSDYPDITARLQNRPEPQPPPFEKREEEPTRLEHKPTPQRAPTLGMNGLTTYTNSRVPDQSPQPQHPEKQPERPEPVPDILAEARQRIAARGGEGRPAERALTGGLELSPDAIAGLERRRL